MPAEAIPQHHPAHRWKHVGIFRALMLGDMLCAVPALRALRSSYPDMRITLIGLPWMRDWIPRFPYIDGFIEFPGYPGLPEIACDHAALPGFLQRMQDEHFDLLVQMHGSGQIVNSLLAACAPRQTAGFRTGDVYCADPSQHIPWPVQGHEIERLLSLTDHLGAVRQGMHLEYLVTPQDRQALAEAWPGAKDAGRYVCIHPGSQLPSRRWDPERFAEVADALAATGHTVVLTGTQAEALLVASVQAHMKSPATNLAGRTPLPALGALLESAALLVCNDTGVSHIAAALRTPSVVISAGSDVSRWAPLDHGRHQVLWQDMACRPCGHPVCPHANRCARAIDVQQVLQAAYRSLEST